MAFVDKKEKEKEKTHTQTGQLKIRVRSLHSRAERRVTKGEPGEMVATQQGANSIFTHINTIVHSWEQIYTFVWGEL